MCDSMKKLTDTFVNIERNYTMANAPKNMAESIMPVHV
jgi:hypothetical protein